MDDAESAYEGTRKSVLYQSSIDESRYRIMPWGNWACDGLIFSWNKETNVIKANSVDTGDDYVEDGENYGRILFSDLTSMDPSYAEYTSTYDPETKTFEFLCAYHFGEYWLGAITETFVIEEEAAAARSQDNRTKGATLNKGVKKQRNLGKPKAVALR